MFRKFFVLIVVIMAWSQVTFAQELAATLEVLSGGVSVQRINTSDAITVQKEAIVGVGDIIKTDATGRARITFFEDGTETDLEPNTEYSIVDFTGQGTTFNLTVEVVLGQTTQRLGRILDADSSYNVQTSGMTLAARGTVFKIRVKDSGQTGMLVSEGTVNASKDEAQADVAPEFGIRAENTGALSDVVRATTFDELDSALDGCTAVLSTNDDVSLNVRISPNSDSARVGTVSASEISLLFGKTESGNWYRIAFRGGFGWILSSTAKIQQGCAGLRVFANTVFEDASLYTSLGDDINMEDLTAPAPTPEATPGS
jgi:hypothetical protein